MILIPQIKKILGEKKLKYIYISHFESDECGGLSQLLKDFPEVTVISSETTARQLMGFGITFNIQQKKGGEIFEGNDFELEFLNYPSEMHLWDGIVAFEKKRGIFISSDLVFIFGEFHGEIREGSWIKEVENSGAKEISEKLFLDLLKLKPNFIATGHGPCVSILK